MNAIEVDDLWKRYYLYHDRHLTLKSAILDRFRHIGTRSEYWALQGATLRIAQGRTVGIIGNNGAGKSTLLRLLSGLSRPTRGQVRYHGRISTLLELGTGFNSEFSGRANVYTSAIVAGFTRSEVRRRFDEIVDFAELWDFIDAPVRTYSNGMYVRLAFATAINVDPDIIMVDEVLAVGDLRFQRKCLDRLLALKQAGKTIVLVSHVMGQIEDLCDEVIWLDAGKVRAHGAPHDVIAQYRERIFAGTQPAAARLDSPTASDRFGSTAPRLDQRTGRVWCRLTSTRLLDEWGRDVEAITTGDAARVDIVYDAPQPVERPIFGIGLYRMDGTKCYDTSTEADGLYLDHILGEGRLSVSFAGLNLMPGTYYIDVGVYERSWEQIYDFHHQALRFTIEGEAPGTGVVFLPHHWTTE